ncbi:hypothetical protein INR49_027259 [Caranx melampygus]|nr:hypothetical protein INR49_027259 [Caranx melampygus]
MKYQRPMEPPGQYTQADSQPFVVRNLLELTVAVRSQAAGCQRLKDTAQHRQRRRHKDGSHEVQQSFALVGWMACQQAVSHSDSIVHPAVDLHLDSIWGHQCHPDKC